MAITILDVATAQGAQPDAAGGISMAEFDRLGLPFFGGCEVCAASIAAYNACPSRTGYLRCAKGCIGDQGFATVDEFLQFEADTDTVDPEPDNRDHDAFDYDDRD
jgi:hypothetical protein